ncbi:WD repeat-containing protein 89 [Choristoneura fumiferana]|uniref:WD repeat-containing protein 89 n=1 Tax=Choristoneura fumiferana TaxID=7141 RepID=UPI003D153C6F
MADIIDTEEEDRDIINAEELEQTFSKKYNLLSETAVSLKKTYINKLATTKSLKIAVSLLDNSIEVYQLNNTSLNKVCRLSGHKKALTDIVFLRKEEHLLHSCGQDGVVKLWDTRASGSCVQEYKDEEDAIVKPFECMDVSCNDRVLCAGSQTVQDDAYLVFWDQRVTKPLGGYWNTHTDDISQVKFHKKKPNILASTALDGLLNIYNIMEPAEDDALTYSLNVENSVEKLTWLSDSQVSCVTQSSDLQVWDTETGDLIRSYDRDKISRTIKRSKGDDCYVVDTYRSADGECVVLAGSHAGNGNVLRSVTATSKKLQPTTNFAANKQTVCCCSYNKERELLVTAGESGLVSVWGAGGGRGGGDGRPAPAGRRDQKAARATQTLLSRTIHHEMPLLFHLPVGSGEPIGAQRLVNCFGKLFPNNLTES